VINNYGNIPSKVKERKIKKHQ